MNNEFYIGWMPKAPGGFTRVLKRVLWLLLPVALVVGLILASFQKRFSRARFEFGTLTEITGMYKNAPVPMLKVLAGKDIWGNTSYISIPLIGYGKHGAETAIRQLENDTHGSFSGKAITLKGTLLYHEGKTLLQVAKDDNPVVQVDSKVASVPVETEMDLGIQELKGEIIDPKCYFGVMKPGEGIPHRDCAIRCIRGGIPPVLRTLDQQGERQFYFIVGASGERMNEAVVDFVAEPVAISGMVRQEGDWKFLYVTGRKIERISAVSLYRPGKQIVSCVSTCMK